jgi:uncharacterized protein YcbX
MSGRAVDADSPSARALATVRRLWRYPVKSLLGEECASVDVDARGVVGDRCYALRDASGKLGSGKNTRRFRHLEGLFRLRARHAGARVEIQFPDGRVMGTDEPGVHDALSSWLGQPVTVAREAGVPFFDQAPIHVVATAALERLRAALPGAAIDERRFRPNLLIDAPADAPLERDWIGRSVGIGDVRLRFESCTERCGMIAFAQADLPRDPAILRYVEEACDLRFGVYANVLAPGTIRCGDAVRFCD